MVEEVEGGDERRWWGLYAEVRAVETLNPRKECERSTDSRPDPFTQKAARCNVLPQFKSVSKAWFRSSEPLVRTHFCEHFWYAPNSRWLSRRPTPFTMAGTPACRASRAMTIYFTDV